MHLFPLIHTCKQKEIRSLTTINMKASLITRPSSFCLTNWLFQMSDILLKVTSSTKSINAESDHVSKRTTDGTGREAVWTAVWAKGRANMSSATCPRLRCFFLQTVYLQIEQVASTLVLPDKQGALLISWEIFKRNAEKKSRRQLPRPWSWKNNAAR